MINKKFSKTSFICPPTEGILVKYMKYVPKSIQCDMLWKVQKVSDMAVESQTKWVCFMLNLTVHSKLSVGAIDFTSKIT